MSHQKILSDCMCNSENLETEKKGAYELLIRLVVIVQIFCSQYILSQIHTISGLYMFVEIELNNISQMSAYC